MFREGSDGRLRVSAVLCQAIVKVFLKLVGAETTDSYAYRNP